MLPPEDQVDLKIFRRKRVPSPHWEGPYEVLLTSYTAISQKKNSPGFLQAMAKLILFKILFKNEF